MLVPLLSAAGQLLVKGVATPEAIDKTWKIATEAPKGPFEIYDIIGLNTAYAVSSTPGSGHENFAAYLKENYIDKGKLDVTTGEGFTSTRATSAPLFASAGPFPVAFEPGGPLSPRGAAALLPTRPGNSASKKDPRAPSPGGPQFTR